MGFSRQEYWSGVPLPSPTSVLVVTYPCSPQPEYLEFQKQDAGVKFVKHSRGARVLAAFLALVMVTMAPCASLLVPGVWDLAHLPLFTSGSYCVCLSGLIGKLTSGQFSIK